LFLVLFLGGKKKIVVRCGYVPKYVKSLMTMGRVLTSWHSLALWWYGSLKALVKLFGQMIVSVLQLVSSGTGGKKIPIAALRDDEDLSPSNFGEIEQKTW
jgi:hypothetical protein